MIPLLLTLLAALGRHPEAVPAGGPARRTGAR